MSEKRVKLTNVLESQFPDYVRSEYPLVVEFIKQYYQSQESQSAPIDLLDNIDQYIKLDENTNTSYSVVLGDDIEEFGDIITVDMRQSPTGTIGFPDTYGLLKIGNEIITYTAKTTTTFTGCLRGFSGVSGFDVGISTSLDNVNREGLLFESTKAESHANGATVTNLSVLFLSLIHI